MTDSVAEVEGLEELEGVAKRKAKPKPIAALERSTGVTNPLVLLQHMIDKGGNPDQLEKMMTLCERWEANQATKEFAEAITKFQRLMPAIVKDNPVKDREGKLMYCFADHADIMEVAQPLLSECGIAVTFSTKFAANLMETTCHVRVGSHVEDTTVTLAIPQIPNANDSQKAGGCISYGQRYSFKAALNIRIKGEDNDAAGMLDTLLLAETNEIERMLVEAGQDRQRFFAWAKEAQGGVEVTEVSGILRKNYGKAVDLLNRKLAQKRKAGAA